MNGKQYEILALTLRYWFVFLSLYILWQSAVRTLKDAYGGNSRRTGNIPFVLVLFTLSAFGLLATRDPAGFHVHTGMLGVLISAIILFQFYLTYYLFRGIDPILLLMVDTLAVLGFIMLQRLTPELALRQVEWFAIANLFFILAMIFMSRAGDLKKLIYPMMLTGIAILLIVFILGEQAGGARRWLAIGPFTVQPSEFVKVIFLFVLAFHLQEHHSFKRNIPLFLFVGGAIFIVVLHKDLGSALHYFLLFTFVYYISTNDWLITLGSIAAGVVGSLISFRIFSHVRVRVQAWRNPWADVGGRGYQVAQSLIAIGSGGLLGFGLGLGEPYVIPASRTDFIFAAICEELGVIVGGMIIALFFLILVRGMGVAFRSQVTTDMLLACGATISLTVQAFIIIGGVIKLIPLTGITLPFISYGGSSLVVSFIILGVIQGISVKNHRLSKKAEEDEDELIDDTLETEGGAAE